jgi:hypothetical protein
MGLPDPVSTPYVAQVSVVGSAAEASASAPAGGSVSVVVNEGLQLLLPLAGLFDVDKELARLTKQKAKVGPGEACHRLPACGITVFSMCVRRVSVVVCCCVS